MLVSRGRSPADETESGQRNALKDYQPQEAPVRTETTSQKEKTLGQT